MPPLPLLAIPTLTPHLLVHSLALGWAGSKLGARNLVLFSYMGGRVTDPSAIISFFWWYALLAGSRIRRRAATWTKHFDIGCMHPKWYCDLCQTMATSSFNSDFSLLLLAHFGDLHVNFKKFIFLIIYQFYKMWLMVIHSFESNESGVTTIFFLSYAFML